MKSPSMPAPSAQETEAKDMQLKLLAKQNAQLDLDEANRKAKTERDTAAIAGGKMGMRSLLSNDWTGFQRGGDLGGRA